MANEGCVMKEAEKKEDRAMTREEILNADDLPLMKIDLRDVEGWERYIYIRAFTGRERDQIDFILIRPGTLDKDGNPVPETREQYAERLDNVRGRLAVMAICDDKGKRFFTDSEAEIVGGKSAVALGRIFDAIMDLNRMGPAVIEELEKN
jgi:hypothetical protein